MHVGWTKKSLAWQQCRHEQLLEGQCCCVAKVMARHHNGHNVVIAALCFIMVEENERQHDLKLAGG
jgi:hypothetical protein